MFDGETSQALAVAEGYDPRHHGVDPCAYLTERVPSPDDGFVRRRKQDLARHWLPRYPGAAGIVDALRRAGLGTGGYPRSSIGYARYASRCGNTKPLRQILLRALLRFGDSDRAGDESDVPRFALLEPASLPADHRTPHPHQIEAWAALSRHLGESEQTGDFAGLLVLPTGAGKSFAAMRWIAEHVLSRGLRVLWVAHRHELLLQAAREVRTAAAYVTGLDRVRVRVVSGRHCRVAQIDPADHVVIASVASLARPCDARDELLRDPRLFVVVDEAHHSAATSYRRLLRIVSETSPRRVLGLTATPTRTEPGERPFLSRLFGGRVLYRIGLRRLVESGVLARPRLVRVATGVDVERGMTDNDLAHLQRFGDLGEDWLVRIAAMAERNAAIVDHYLAERARYGTTVMFAISVAHAAVLAEQLRQRGVRADYVAWYRPDGTPADDASLIQRLRAGELDVLVSVQKLTEGVDVPGVQTVFLARPTGSEILFRQMIGRALRGPSAGGAEDAFLVAFEDQWARFRDWEHPFDLVPDIVDLAEPTEDRAGARASAAEDALPWELVRAVARELRLRSSTRPVDVFEAIPVGWFVLEQSQVDQGRAHPIPVYGHHARGWEGLIDEVYRDATDLDPLRLYGDWFCDSREPGPSQRDVELVVAHRLAGGARPRLVAVADRDVSDPRRIARQIWDDDLRERDRGALVESRYVALARVVYPELRQFAAAVDDALAELRFGCARTAVASAPVQ